VCGNGGNPKQPTLQPLKQRMRYDVYPNPVANLRAAFPCVMEIQSDRLYTFAERICIPLAKPDAFPGMTERLNPAVEVAGFDEALHLHPLGITVFFQRELRDKIDNLQRHSLLIDSAVEFLLRGY
jgi:toxin CcdB